MSEPGRLGSDDLRPEPEAAPATAAVVAEPAPTEDLNRYRYVTADRHDVLTIQVIWLALILSILVHVAALWKWLPDLQALQLTGPDKNQTAPSLVARLSTPPPPPPPPPAAAPSVPTPPLPEPREPPVQRKAPTRTPAPPVARTPVITAPPKPQPTPSVPSLPTPPPAVAPPPPAAPTPPPVAAAPPPMPAPPAGDLASYIASRRLARGVSPVQDSPQIEDDNARRNRIVAENLASTNKLTFGYDPRTAGGVFVMKHVGIDEAEFIFNGWNKDVGRQTRQLIEVRRGGAPDIQTAVIRKIISIIREQEPNDFTWRSTRLGKDIVLSARAQDNAGLEDFMMREFFTESRQPY